MWPADIIKSLALMNIAVSACSEGHTKAFPRVSCKAHSEIICFPLSMMVPWVGVLLCVIISGDLETIFHSLGNVYSPCPQSTSLTLRRLLGKLTVSVWEKRNLVHIYHIKVWFIFSSIYIDMLSVIFHGVNSAKGTQFKSFSSLLSEWNLPIRH